MNKKVDLAGVFLIFVLVIIMFDVSLAQQSDKSVAILYVDFERSVPDEDYLFVRDRSPD